MLCGVDEPVTEPELTLSQDASAYDLGVQSDARAPTGEHGEVMLIGEAGFGGEGLARKVISFSSFSSVGDEGGGDLDEACCFLSL